MGALSIGDLVEGDDTTSVSVTVVGDGEEGDPLVITASVTPGATVITTPSNGGSTSIDSGTRAQLLNHGSTIASHTLTLPSDSTALEKEIKIVAASTITALTVSPGAGTTVAGMPTTIAANGYFRVQLIGTVWRRVG